jgi:hypothetical protein
MKTKLIDVSQEITTKAYSKNLRNLEDEELQNFLKIDDSDLRLENPGIELKANYWKREVEAEIEARKSR